MSPENKPYTVALIPARHGSKRVPGKNTRLLNGRPLIEYSIEHAHAAKRIDKTVVSTDDKTVEEIARRLDCEVIRRPPELAEDSTPTLPVIRHALKILSSNGGRIDYLVLLQPTVPMRNTDKIDEAIGILEATRCDSVISHIRVDYFHPNRMKRIVDGRVIPYCEEEIEGVSRDKLPEAYYRDGSIYAMRTEVPLKKNTLFGGEVRAVINERRDFINIDDEESWLFAELLMKSRIRRLS